MERIPYSKSINYSNDETFDMDMNEICGEITSVFELYGFEYDFDIFTDVYIQIHKILKEWNLVHK